MPTGSLVVAILLHVPYVRRAGVWPHGEWQLHAAIADSFLPLLDGLLALQEDEIAPRLTLALSPLLAEQLADPFLRAGFEDYLVRRIREAEDAAPRLPGPLADVACWHRDRDSRLLDSWSTRHGRDLVRTLRKLAQDGAVEIIAVPATAAVLPLLPRSRAATAQVQMGLASAEHHLEHRPLGLWLPGGAIAPRGALEPMFNQDNWRRAMFTHEDREPDLPGTDDILCDCQVTYTLVGEHALHGGKVSPTGPSPLDLHTTPGGLALLTRHDGLFNAWFDPQRGFPADPAYLGPPDAAGTRFRHRTHPPIAFPPRAEAANLELTVGAGSPGNPYDPAAAQEAVNAHARQAVAAASRLLDSHQERTGRPGLIVLPLDAKLFGDWIEGPQWLCEFVRAGVQAGLGMASGAQAVHLQPALPLEALHPSSWEPEGDFRRWRAPNTTWYWEVVSGALVTLESLIDRYSGTGHPLAARTLAQVVREGLLLEAGEWPAMLGSGGEDRDYAADRVRFHHDRFRLLAEMLAAGDFDENFDAALLAHFEELDNPFETLNYEPERVL